MRSSLPDGRSPEEVLDLFVPFARPLQDLVRHELILSRGISMCRVMFGPNAKPPLPIILLDTDSNRVPMGGWIPDIRDFPLLALTADNDRIEAAAAALDAPPALPWYVQEIDVCRASLRIHLSLPGGPSYVSDTLIRRLGPEHLHVEPARRALLPVVRTASRSLADGEERMLAATSTVLEELSAHERLALETERTQLAADECVVLDELLRDSAYTRTTLVLRRRGDILLLQRRLGSREYQLLLASDLHEAP